MTDWYDSQAVGWAASLGCLRSLKLLLIYGAEPFKVNKAGNCSLKDARREKHQKIIRFLEEYQRARESGSFTICDDEAGSF